jgi:hypothetical protein
MFQTEKLKLKYRLKALFDGLNQQVTMITCYKFRFLSITGLLFFGLCIFALGWFAQSKSLQMLQIHGVEYLGAPSVGQGGVASVKEIKSPHELNSMDISFEFMTQEPTFSYGNLFQTADSINAIRMELQPSNNLVLVLGSSNVFPLSSSIQIGKYYDVRLTYEREHFFKVFVDKKEVLNVTDKKLLAGDFDISNIVVGTGLAKQRMLVGEVKNFNLNGAYSYTDQVGCLSRWLLVLLGILICIKLLKHIFKKYLPQLLELKLLRSLSNQQKIVWTSTVVSVGFMASIVYHYVKSVYYPFPDGLRTMFQPSINMFCDFFSLFDVFSKFGLSKQSLYFPFSYVLLGLFGWMGSGNVYVAVIFSLALASGISIWLTWFSFRKSFKTGALLNAFVVLMMSYPMLFTLHTGNLEIWVFIFLSSFFLSYYSGHLTLSTGFLAAAISLKLYPAIFIVLLVVDKRYRLVSYSLAWVVVLSLLPFLIWPTDLKLYWQGLSYGMGVYHDIMIKKYFGVYFGHSLVNSLRALWPNIKIESLFPSYYIFAGCVLILMTVYAALIERVLWRKIAILVIALCLLPPTSTDYKLLLFFIPFFFFVNYDVRSKTDSIYTLLFSALFINKAYLYFHDNQYVTLNIVANTLIMIGMLIVILVEHFMDSRRKVHKYEKARTYL